MSAQAGRPRDLLWLAAGYVAWSAAFVTLYAGLSVGCAFGWDEVALIGPVSAQRVMLVVLFLLSVAACAWVVLLARRQLAMAARGGDAQATLGFVHWVAVGAAITATLATAISLGPVFLPSMCV